VHPLPDLEPAGEVGDGFVTETSAYEAARAALATTCSSTPRHGRGRVTRNCAREKRAR